MTNPRPPDIVASRRLEVETPETVVLEFELAGLGARAAATVIDGVLLLGLLLLFDLAGELMFGTEAGGTWATALLFLAAFGVMWGYFVLFEGLWSGRTPGKRWAGIRVVMDTGHRITLPAAIVRNLLRLADLQPIATYGVGIAFLVLQRHHKRLGDLAAGTVVVRDRPEETALGLEEPAAAPDHAEQLTAADRPALLTDDEYRLLDRFLGRMDDLAPAARSRFMADLAGRFAARVTERSPNVRTFLIELHDEETARRRARTGVRRGRSGTKAAGTAERFVALRRPTWEAFRQRALQLEQSGLSSLSGEDLLLFAAHYREVAADLARARTYGVDPRVLGYLERVVTSGHNALYGLRGVRRVPLQRLVFQELPAAVYRCRAYVLAAFLMFAAPAAVGYVLIRQDPAVAYRVIPDNMIARAESGAYQRAQGTGYAEYPSLYLPLVASRIIANNVQVAFQAFAYGITGGVGTLFVLLFNGLFFGAVVGLFANFGVADWILTFVAGHGVLELSAIFVSGGAGLLIGHALIAPGDLTRMDALVVRGRLAVRLVGAAALMLLLAGIIEGLLSASSAAAPLKLLVSGLSAALLGLFWLVGRQSARAGVGPT